MTNTRAELADELEADRGANRVLDARIAVALYDGSGHADPRDDTHARLPSKSDECAPGTYWISAFSGLSLRTAPDYTSDPTLKRLALSALRGQGEGFQQRVGEWMQECFGPVISADRLERRDRLVEEALELAQTLPAFTADRAHALVDYVFSRPVGATEQEVGGVSVTLAALCEAEGIEQTHWAEAELSRITRPEIVLKIRAKQATKPTGLALPIPAPPSQAGDDDDAHPA